MSAEVFDPREFCREEMAERGLAEVALPATIRRWLRGDRELTPMVAQSLSVLFSTTSELWLNLDAAWLESKS